MRKAKPGAGNRVACAWDKNISIQRGAPAPAIASGMVQGAAVTTANEGHKYQQQYI